MRLTGDNLKLIYLRRVLLPIARKIPLLGPRLVHKPAAETPASAGEQSVPFTSSAEYWDKRYTLGDNSGPGSYGRLAHFKAKFLNGFVRKQRILSVVEFGCGDGSQLALAKYPQYTGVDVSQKAVDLCRGRFAGDASKRFLPLEDIPESLRAELALSLDVIFHLVEDGVFDAYMRRLFDSATRFVIVYSSNKEQPWPNPHVRHREFTKWVAENRPDWRLHSVVKNRYPYDPADPEHTSFADFYVFARA